MTKNYELTIILPESSTQKEMEAQVADLLKKNGGKVSETNFWGVKDLAYPIKKQARGAYGYFELELEPAEATSLNGRLRIDEKILRHLLVVANAKIKKEEPKKVTNKKSVKGEEKATKSKAKKK